MKIVTRRQLPELAWTGTGLSVKKWRPITPTPERNMLAVNKPVNAGLRTSPIKRSTSGRILGCDWQLRDWENDQTPDEITLVHPQHSAKILQIDTVDDLHEALDRWPDRRMPLTDLYPIPLGHRRGVPEFARIDWPAMAEEFDIFYLSQKGLKATAFSYPVDLWGWDVPTALFLQPAFKVGKRVLTPPEDWQEERLRMVEDLLARIEQQIFDLTDTMIAELETLRHAMLARP